MQRYESRFRSVASLKSKVDVLVERLTEVKEAYQQLIKAGVSRELLAIYLAHKCGMSMRKARQVLEHTDEFYEMLIATEVTDNL